ncbi:hypothetical protein [Sorangium cellulosum]|uniref:hypothetical protein n=1 Tax=Sorangium cellulosum TaxID=56 RepID=UPI00042082C5|nr:hypothetical protein [Sorangium cellulosum]
MGFWPFGSREPANVESASQIVTAAARRETVRGKLTLYFKAPQTQSAASKAAERCAQIAGDLLRETGEQEPLLGREAELAAAIAARAPRGVPALRAIELASLHVVTDRTTQSRRNRLTPVPPLVADPLRSAGTRAPSSRPPADPLRSAGTRAPSSRPPADPLRSAGTRAPSSRPPADPLRSAGTRAPSSRPPADPLRSAGTRAPSSRPPADPLRSAGTRAPSSRPPADPLRSAGTRAPSSRPPADPLRSAGTRAPSSRPPADPLRSAGTRAPSSRPPADPLRSAGTRAPSSRPPPGGMPTSAPPPSSRNVGQLPSPPPVLGHGSPSSIPPSSVRSPPSSGAYRLRGAGAGNGRGSSPGLVGSPPTVIAAALAPLLRDASTRLLLGCLRAHDLIIVRRVAIDPGAAEQRATLLPVSEAPPGELEASRAAELARWHAVLGSPVISQLRAESCTISAQKARMALSTAAIPPGLVGELVDALCRTAFPGFALSSAHIDRYVEHDLSELAAESVARILRHPNSKQLRLALGPLLEAVQTDMDAISSLAKASLGSAP